MPSLIGVQFSGTKLGANSWSAEDKIIGILEFDIPLNEKTLKELQIQTAFFLVPVIQDYKQEEVDASSTNVTPSSRGVMPSDTTLYRLVFKANSLKRGHCYRLSFASNKSINIDSSMRSSSEFEFCVSACGCSLTGTASCNEETEGEPECICRANYAGVDCSDCASGFVHNSHNECIRGSQCVQDGGNIDCNGHG